MPCLVADFWSIRSGWPAMKKTMPLGTNPRGMAEEKESKVEIDRSVLPDDSYWLGTDAVRRNLDHRLIFRKHSSTHHTDLTHLNIEPRHLPRIIG